MGKKGKKGKNGSSSISPKKGKRSGKKKGVRLDFSVYR
jgi:hypothetical protein